LNGPFNPQQSLLNAFGGLTSAGNWTLVIQNSNSQSLGGTLNSWSLYFEKPQPTSGLGEPTADQTEASFRIFTMDPTNALSHDTWTAVGPAPIVAPAGEPTHTGSIGGLAVDPSDPSGNTVFVVVANGGIWKTTDFLTTNPNGPTYIPLTDFGPTNAINIDGIAVFPRQNNPNKSLVIASTGNGDSGSSGVGFLISQDGGASWNLYDSTTNVDASGNLLPLNSTLRDHAFVGSTSFKVVVDPNLTPDGQVIIYAALGGTNGGLWRSLDSGAHWTNLRAGQCTDVVLDPASNTGGSGNLQIVYAAFQGEGVFFSQNQGQSLALMAGGVGNPLICSKDTGLNVNPVAGLTPNGPEGRIVLAKPALTGNPVQDQIYQGWLYAAVATPGGGLYGIFLTKDFGQNWTQIRIASLLPSTGAGSTYDQAIPTNDISNPDYKIFGGAGSLNAQGNYDIALAIDPNNPNIIYLGGDASSGGTGLIRIDTTAMWDAHALVPYADNALGRGVQQATTGASP